MESFCAECGSAFGDLAAAFCGSCSVARPAMGARDVSVGTEQQPYVQQSAVSAPPLATAQYANPQPPQPIYQPTQYVGQPQPVAGHTSHSQVAPKSPGLALLLSFFIPGLGTMLNGQGAKGVLIFLGWFFSTVFVVALGWLFVGLAGIPFVIAFFIWGLVDAYVGAQRWNARHGIIS